MAWTTNTSQISASEEVNTGVVIPDDVEELLNTELVCAITKLSRNYVDNLSKAGLMPKPIKIGRLNRWRKKEIQQWIAAKQ